MKFKNTLKFGILSLFCSLSVLLIACNEKEIIPDPPEEEEEVMEEEEQEE
mgnify:CR=1 FL=1